MPTLVLCLAASALALMAVWPASSAGAAPKAPATARLSTPPILARGGDPARRSGARSKSTRDAKAKSASKKRSSGSTARGKEKSDKKSARGRTSERDRGREARRATRHRGKPARITSRRPEKARIATKPARISGKPRIAAKPARIAARPVIPALIVSTTGRPPFGGRYAGRPGFHRHLPGHRALLGEFVGWLGPVFWPYAYDDLVGYAFWPAEYDPAYWGQAYDDVIGSVLAYGTEAPAPEESGERWRAPRSRSGVRGLAAQSRGYAEICGDGATDVTKWPIVRISEAVTPNGQQKVALDDLKAASARATEILQAACPARAPTTPLGRLAAMEQRLAAMIEAARILRPALERLHDMLDEAQKARFNAVGAPPEQAVAGERREAGGVCGEQGAALPAQSIGRIEQVVRPEGAQRTALDTLREASISAAGTLRAACAGETPPTPPGRLDTTVRRLEAMREALQTVRPALASFYASLSDEQKARFNRISLYAGRPAG